MNSAPAPAGNGEPGTAENPPVLLMANAETLPEPELLTKANAVVCPVDINMLPIMPPHPAVMMIAHSRAAGMITKQICRQGGGKRRSGEIMRSLRTGQSAPKHYRLRLVRFEPASPRFQRRSCHLLISICHIIRVRLQQISRCY